MIRLGVIGYGRRIHNVIDGCLRPVEPDLRVVGIVDPDEAGVREYAWPPATSRTWSFTTRWTSWCAAANQTRWPSARAATCTRPMPSRPRAYDLPLYLEKPVAISMEQAIALERAFEGSHCPVVVSFPLRVSPLCELAREYMRDGAVGEPVHIAALNYVPYGTVYWERPYRNFEITQGLFLQKATHDLDYMSYLMGSADRARGGDGAPGSTSLAATRRRAWSARRVTSRGRAWRAPRTASATGPAARARITPACTAWTVARWRRAPTRTAPAPWSSLPRARTGSTRRSFTRGATRLRAGRR